MGNLDFFATGPDLENVISFLFSETDFRVFDSYSTFGEELRQYHSFDELAACHDIGMDRHGNGAAVPLQLWSPSVMSEPVIERITLDPRKCKGFTFRYAIRGFGLVQLYLGGIHDRIVTVSHFGHFSERGARRKGYTEGVDWQALQKISGRVQRHISRTLAVAKAPGRPVLAGALDKFKEGYQLKEFRGHPHLYAPVPIRRT